MVFLNKADAADKDTVELVEMEVRDLLKHYKYPNDTPVIAGSALCALEVPLFSHLCVLWFSSFENREFEYSIIINQHMFAGPRQSGWT